MTDYNLVLIKFQHIGRKATIARFQNSIFIEFKTEIPSGAEIDLSVKAEGDVLWFKIGSICRKYKRAVDHKERADLEIEKLLQSMTNPKMVRLQLNYNLNYFEE